MHPADPPPRAAAALMNAQIPPATNPPRWAPIEIPGIENVKTRLRITIKPICEARSLRPRSLAIRNAAARRPKIAPEAPTARASGSSRITPSEPPRSDTA